MSRSKSRRRHSVNAPQLNGSIECVEQRCLLSADGVLAEVAAIDGSGNNVTNVDWGATDQDLLRIGTVEYGDGLTTPAGEDRPSARAVSNALAAQEESVENARFLTDYIWIWGQFLDHDIDLTEGATPVESFDIEVPAGDPHFDPTGSGDVTIGLTRSNYEIDESGVRQQVNQITAFIDGSVIYGSDAERAAALRTFAGGHLRTSDGDLLPFNDVGLANAGGSGDSLFLAGDIRANENVALISMQTLWVREHNRVADELAAANPDLSDEELYQAARSRVVAELQAITYNEFLPALLGEGALDAYTGYDATVNPGIANLFSTAAYRLGHSMLSSELQRVDADGNEIAAGNLPLQSAFFNPGEVIDLGIDSILQGAATQLAQEIDTLVIDDVRNFLFGPPGAGGFDLVSLNIQRGRDHGLPDYNQARIDLGLEPVTSFEQITSNPEIALALEQTYGDVNEIDVWVGGLAEDHLPGSSVGELFSAVLVDQFERLRDGDRFWYQNVYSGTELADIEATTLKDVIERNSNVVGLQDNVFFDSSVFRIDLAELQARDVVVEVNDRSVRVFDAGSRAVLAERSLDSTSQVQVIGDDQASGQITVRMRGADLSLPGGIVLSGGDSTRDRLVLETGRGSDSIAVTASEMTVNSVEFVHEGFEVVRIDSGSGQDQVVVESGMNVEIVDRTRDLRRQRLPRRQSQTVAMDRSTARRTDGRDRDASSQAAAVQNPVSPLDLVFGSPLDELLAAANDTVARRSGRRR